MTQNTPPGLAGEVQIDIKSRDKDGNVTGHTRYHPDGRVEQII